MENFAFEATEVHKSVSIQPCKQNLILSRYAVVTKRGEWGKNPEQMEILHFLTKNITINIKISGENISGESTECVKIYFSHPHYVYNLRLNCILFYGIIL